MGKQNGYQIFLEKVLGFNQQKRIIVTITLSLVAMLKKKIV